MSLLKIKSTGYMFWSIFLNVVIVFFHSVLLFPAFIAYFDIQPYEKFVAENIISDQNFLYQKIFFGVILTILYFIPMFFVTRALRKKLLCFYGFGVILTGWVGFFALSSEILHFLRFSQLSIHMTDMFFFSAIFLWNIFVYFTEGFFQAFILSRAGDLPYMKSLLIVVFTWTVRASFILLVSFIMPYFIGDMP